MKRCRNCHAVYDDDMPFCVECGALESDPVDSPKAADPVVTEPETDPEAEHHWVQKDSVRNMVAKSDAEPEEKTEPKAAEPKPDKAAAPSDKNGAAGCLVWIAIIGVVVYFLDEIFHFI